MKVLATTILVFVACLQADGRSIGVKEDIPKVLQETMEQSFNCAMQLGPKAANLPKVKGLEQYPEDNEDLNQLWGCIFLKKHIINHDGDINTEKLHNYLMDTFTIFVPANDLLRSLADEVTESCKNVEGDDYQLKSIKLQNCLSRKIKEVTGE